MADTLLRIDNAGAAIASTNFWQTTMAQNGKFFLSPNAGAFRLLVPRQHLGVIRDMRGAHTVVVSRGPLTLAGQRVPDALEILFDDGSDNPWALHLTPQACDRMPLDADATQTWTCTVWRQILGERCQQVRALPCHYRRVRQLPDLRPWQP